MLPTPTPMAGIQCRREGWTCPAGFPLSPSGWSIRGKSQPVAPGTSVPPRKCIRGQRCGVQPRPASSAEGLCQYSAGALRHVSPGAQPGPLGMMTLPVGRRAGPQNPLVRTETQTGVRSLPPPRRAWAAVARREPLHPRTRAWLQGPGPVLSSPNAFFPPLHEGTMTFSSQQGDMVPQTPPPLSPRRLAAPCHSLLESGHT